MIGVVLIVRVNSLIIGKCKSTIIYFEVFIMKCEANMNNRGKKFGKFLSGSAHQSFLSPMHFTNIFVSFYSPALKQN